jgi:hypothetical protein
MVTVCFFIRRASHKIMMPNIGGNVTALRKEFLASLQILLGQF